ncbi:MAG: ATP-binding protein [Defluviitaleaceae bacterium]|nr:ATP-binding protein [Defluviitaleaceae bacterium]MCL2275576.1 ATP-binding protein [Defluviitaleaceae bacterium]
MGRINFLALFVAVVAGMAAAAALAFIFFNDAMRTLVRMSIQSVPFLLLMFMLLFIIVYIVSSKLTRHIASAINKIDLDTPEHFYDELEEFYQYLLRRERQTEDQISDIRAHNATMNALIENMQDGFAVVAPSGQVITANPRAVSLFGARQNPVGKNVITLLSDTAFLEMVDNAMVGKGGQMSITKNERVVQVSFVPSANQGVIILSADNTEKNEAEKMRREFSANVSHELKTPLTVISGCAELLMAGMVEPDDVARFAEKINLGAKRMLELIENILIISRLDEKDMRETFLPHNLADIATEVVDSLSQIADKQQVGIVCNAESLVLQCNKLLIYEMMLNLINNAIQYNVPGGKVEVTVQAVTDEDNVAVCLVSISDTGIGIPEADQKKIFERFYRVEQSRGRKTGGAGLGLSIVKNVVRYHNGNISLTSDAGSGTRIDVSLPIT